MNIRPPAFPSSERRVSFVLTLAPVLRLTRRRLMSGTLRAKPSRPLQTNGQYGTRDVTYAPKTGEWNLYDTVGGLTQTYDANKNLTSDGVLAMTYDADNRLTDLDKSGVFTQDLVYDWRGRLIKKTVTPNGGSAATTRYYYSGWTVVAEVNESGGAYLHKYVHGPGIDELLTDETGGNTYYVLSDLLGSTSALITGATVSTITVAQRHTYDPYGTPTIRDSAGDPSAAAPITNYLYTGHEYDKLSGLYNYRNRFYHPGLGRFLQPDPIGFDGGTNLNSYVENEPDSSVDPDGLRLIKVIIWPAKFPYTGKNGSVGHVKLCEADGTRIMSLFPKPKGLIKPCDNKTNEETDSNEKVADSIEIPIWVPDDQAFNDACAKEIGKSTWSFMPVTKNTTNCAMGASKALKAGGVDVRNHITPGGLRRDLKKKGY